MGTRGGCLYVSIIWTMELKKKNISKNLKRVGILRFEPLYNFVLIFRFLLNNGLISHLGLWDKGYKSERNRMCLSISDPRNLRRVLLVQTGERVQQYSTTDKRERRRKLHE